MASVPMSLEEPPYQCTSTMTQVRTTHIWSLSFSVPKPTLSPWWALNQIPSAPPSLHPSFASVHWEGWVVWRTSVGEESGSHYRLTHPPVPPAHLLSAMLGESTSEFRGSCLHAPYEVSSPSPSPLGPEAAVIDAIQFLSTDLLHH
jgi:hypothetical protein